VYWMYSIELDPELGVEAETVIRELRGLGVEARPFFMGLHLQPALQGKMRTPYPSYKKTEHAYRYGLYLPSGLTLDEATIDRVVDTLQTALAKSKSK